MQLWLEVKSGGEGQKRREANLVWKEKIEEVKQSVKDRVTYDKEKEWGGN